MDQQPSTICECRDIFTEVEENHLIPTPLNTYNHNTASRLALPALKKETNKIIARKYANKYSDKAETLTFQGEFLNLIKTEQLDVTWKSYIFAVPRGVMSFAMRASTNSLATPDNLARWWMPLASFAVQHNPTPGQLPPWGTSSTTAQ